LAGCGPGNRAAENRDRLNVTVTIFPPYDFTREIAGDLVNLTMLLPPGSESHSYEPSPRDIITLQNSDVFIYVGGESDEWVRDILASMDTSKMKILALMDCVSPVEEEIVEGMEDEEDDALAALGIEVEAEYDEHVWTSPQNAALIVGAITRTLTGADPAHGEDYQRKSSAYIEELASLDAAFRAVVDRAARKTNNFGDRFPFR
jgi:zinc transport system substrate-binding protein